MRRWMIASGVCVLVVPIGLISYRHLQPRQKNAEPARARSVLDVDELMNNLDQHRDRIRVEGVVGSIATEDKVLSLIDAREFKKCGVTTCARLQLPVRWAGTMPRVGEHVEAEGEVQEWAGKLVFAATTLTTAPVE